MANHMKINKRDAAEKIIMRMFCMYIFPVCFDKILPLDKIQDKISIYFFAKKLFIFGIFMSSI